MGVELAVVQAIGFCIKIGEYGALLRENKEKSQDEDLYEIIMQDSYGNAAGDAHALIALKDNVELIMDLKVGMTPFSFLRDQHYPSTEIVRAGARRYFAVGCYHEVPEEYAKTKESLLAVLPPDLAKICQSEDFNKWLFSYYH